MNSDMFRNIPGLYSLDPSSISPSCDNEKMSPDIAKWTSPMKEGEKIALF